MAMVRMQPWTQARFELALPPLMVESVYFAAIVAICLLIYLKTREIEKLASHKGITYFRLTFLHFAVSYFFKFITSLQVFSFGMQRGHWVLQAIPTAWTMFISLYASLMAAIYLVNSITWKDGTVSPHEGAFWSITSLTAAGLTIFMGQPWLYILSQAFLFAYAAYVLATSEKKSTFIRAVYPALLGFWLLSIVDIFIPDMLLLLQTAVYLISAVLFSTILYRVLRRVG